MVNSLCKYADFFLQTLQSPAVSLQAAPHSSCRKIGLKRLLITPQSFGAHYLLTLEKAVQLIFFLRTLKTTGNMYLIVWPALFLKPISSLYIRTSAGHRLKF